MTKITRTIAKALDELTIAYPETIGCAAHTQEGAINGTTAKTLVRLGYARQTQERPSRYILTTNGALFLLAELAGWRTPADSGDPSVIRLCAQVARDRGLEAGWTDDLVRHRIDPLLEACNVRALAAAGA